MGWWKAWLGWWQPAGSGGVVEGSGKVVGSPGTLPKDLRAGGGSKGLVGGPKGGLRGRKARVVWWEVWVG